MAGHFVILKNQQFGGMLRAVLDNSDCTDLVLIADGEKKVKCHQAYLAAASPFFKAILESHPQALRDVCISVPGVTYRDLKTAIDLLYNGEVYVSRERRSCINELVEILGFPCFSETHHDLSDTSTIDILSEGFESDAATPSPAKRPRQEGTSVRTNIGPKTQLKEQTKVNKEGKVDVHFESRNIGRPKRSGEKEKVHMQDHGSDSVVRPPSALRHSDKRERDWQTRAETNADNFTPDSGHSTRSSKRENHESSGSGDQNSNVLGIWKSPRTTKKGSRLLGWMDANKCQKELGKAKGASPKKNKKRDESEEHVKSDFDSDVSSVFVVGRERKRRVFKNYITSLDSATENEKDSAVKHGRKRRVTKEPSKLSKASEDFVFMSPMRSRSKLREPTVRLEHHIIDMNPKVIIRKEDTTKLLHTSRPHKPLPNAQSPVVRLKRLSLEEVQRMTKRWRCDDCDLNFNSHWLSALHRSTKCEKIVPEQCLLCEYKFDNYVSYVLHSAMHCMKEHGKCPVCNASDVVDMDEHMFIAGHLPEKLKAYECDVCWSKFTKSEDRAIHLKAVHGRDGKDLTENASLSCEHCNVDFLTAEALGDHQSQKPQTCCVAKYFKTERRGMSRCTICNRLVFGDINRLRNHLSSHVDENGVICDEIDKDGKTSEDGPGSAETPSASQEKDNAEIVISQNKNPGPSQEKENVEIMISKSKNPVLAKQVNRQNNGVMSASDMDDALPTAGKICVYCNTCPSTYKKHINECSSGVFTLIGEKMAHCKICDAMVSSRNRHSHFRLKHVGIKRPRRKYPSGHEDIMLALMGAVMDHPFFCSPGKESDDPPSSVQQGGEAGPANRPASVVIEDEELPIVIVDEVNVDTGNVPNLPLEIEEAANRRSSLGENETQLDKTAPSIACTSGVSSPTFLDSDVEFVGSPENVKSRRFSETRRREKKSSSLKSNALTEGINVLEVDLQEVEKVRDDCEESADEIIEVTQMSPYKVPSEFVSVVYQEDTCVEEFCLEDTTEI